MTLENVKELLIGQYGEDIKLKPVILHLMINGSSVTSSDYNLLTKKFSDKDSRGIALHRYAGFVTPALCTNMNLKLKGAITWAASGTIEESFGFTIFDEVSFNGASQYIVFAGYEMTGFNDPIK